MSAIVMVGIIMLTLFIGNMLPSFAVPTLKALNKSERSESFRLAIAKTKVQRTGWYLDSPEKRYINACIDKGETIDMGYLIASSNWDKTYYDSGRVSAADLADFAYGKYVNTKNLTADEKKEVFETFLNRNVELVNDYVSNKYGLNQVLSTYQKRNEYKLSNIQANLLSSSNSHQVLLESWNKDYTNSEKG